MSGALTYVAFALIFVGAVLAAWRHGYRKGRQKGRDVRDRAETLRVALVAIRAGLNLGPVPPEATVEELAVMDDAWQATHELWKVIDSLAVRVAEAEKALEAMCALERWLALQYPNSGTVREETVIRRCLWALRGSNDEPPHPDRSAR